MSQQQPHALVVLCDLNRHLWPQQTPQALDRLFNGILLLLKSCIAINPSPLSMTTAVIGFNETHCAYLFDSLDTATPGDDEEKLADDEQLFSGYLPFESLENRIRQRLAAFSEPVVSAKDRHSQLSQALSMSLCYINRLRKIHGLSSGQQSTAPATTSDARMKFTTSDGGKHLSARILILSIDSDSPSQYISIMNSIFSAQKSSVTVDVCRLVISNTNTTEDSIFQQQAAFITGGIYLKLKDLSQLPQYLMSCYLIDPQNRRQHLQTIRCEREDLRAACFCHRRIIDVGHICSACLSIFCQPKSSCPTCGVEFESDIN